MGALAVLCSCSRAHDGYSFISAEELVAAGEEDYVFHPDFFDTTANYSTYIAARVDPAVLKSDILTLDILVVSPDGELAAERFDFPLRSCGGKVVARSAEGSSVDVEWPYRDNIKVGSGLNAPGVWTVRITPQITDSRSVLGIGFRYSDNGKR